MKINEKIVILLGADQQPAATSWDGFSSGPSFFSSEHAVLQTHPSGSSRYRPGAGLWGFDDKTSAELRRNPSLSAPEECARACREGEPPRICYYHFTVEYYTVLGA